MVEVERSEKYNQFKSEVLSFQDVCDAVQKEQLKPLSDDDVVQFYSFCCGEYEIDTVVYKDCSPHNPIPITELGSLFGLNVVAMLRVFQMRAELYERMAQI